MTVRCDDLVFPVDDAVDAHETHFMAEWWRRSDRSPAPWHGVLARRVRPDGYESLRRSDLFALVREGHDNGALLLACLAWGVGMSPRGEGASNFNVGRRAQVFKKNDLRVLDDRLRAARDVLATKGAVAAYASMSKGVGDHYVRYLGPAFFTKFLYVVDHESGREGVHALILDENVAKALRRCHDPGFPLRNWSPKDFGVWLEIAHRVAAEASTREQRPVRPDAVEMRYFLLGRNGS